VPGSGGLEVNVDGEVAQAEPMYNTGMDPIQYEDGDAEKTRRLREKWSRDQFDKDEKV
jgi:hypothetical protein